ncbi:MAG: hypothetical protein KKG60_00755 [Nanoarchaeota archaeon]|nr:hypothetical protein [Nanoarchaeota archaeon]
MAEAVELKEDTKKDFFDEKNKVGEYYLEIEEPGAGIEGLYFWILSFLQGDPPSGLGFKKIHKIKDIYSASETSSYFGMVEQRKGLQQEKVTQYLGLLSNMTKTMFQVMRELKIIDERYSYYNKSKEGDEDAEIALKSIWVDMVEGGAKNPSSVTGLASQVGFVILPDLFYKIHPKNGAEVRKYVDALEKEGINRKVREVLSRKLTQYLTWKERTDSELAQRRIFVLKYLRQQYNSMKVYISWLRPYLKNLKKLQMAQQDRPELVTAFETSVIELEILAKIEQKKGEAYHPCIRVRFEYVAIPQMAYQREYQRGAIHTGVSKIWIESYALNDKEIKDYLDEQEQEDFELLTSLNESMDVFKDDFKKYLTEAGEEFKEDKKPEPKKPKFLKELFSPFTGIFKGFKHMSGKQEGKKEKPKWTMEQDKKKAEGTAGTLCLVLYDVFKKSHQMLAW